MIITYKVSSKSFPLSIQEDPFMLSWKTRTSITPKFWTRLQEHGPKEMIYQEVDLLLHVKFLNQMVTFENFLSTRIFNFIDKIYRISIHVHFLICFINFQVRWEFFLLEDVTSLAMNIQTTHFSFLFRPKNGRL